MKKTQKINILYIKIGMIFISIISIILLLFSWFNKNITPKLIYLSEKNINKYIEHIASDFKIFILEKNASDEFLHVKENQQKEIVGLDYDMTKIYELANKLIETLEKNINDSSFLNQYTENNKFENIEEGLVLYYPIGIISDSVFLSNLGPKIPVLIKFIPSIFSNVKSRVKDYGINNALLEVYLEISITYNIITPITEEEKKINYELLIDSKVIQGTVPNIYGGIMENRSVFFDIPFWKLLCYT